MSAMAAGTGTEPGTLDAATGHVEDIKLASLKDDAGQFRVIKVRERVDPDVVAEYAEKMRAGRTFEPIVVFEDDDGIRWIAEGSHRCPAAEKAGKMHICGYRRRGSHRDAILYAVGTNSTHGKQRTRGDKREAVKRLLEDAEWAQWTDGVIAEACDVSASTVANIRKELASLSSQNGTMDGGAGASSQVGMMERTVVRGGKTYTMKVRGKTQKSAPAATATATDTEVEDADAAPYRETMHSLIATLRDIRDKVDAVSRDGLTPAMLAAITVDGLSAADVAYTLTGGHYARLVCEHVQAQAKPRRGGAGR